MGFAFLRRDSSQFAEHRVQLNRANTVVRSGRELFSVNDGQASSPEQANVQEQKKWMMWWR